MKYVIDPAISPYFRETFLDSLILLDSDCVESHAQVFPVQHIYDYPAVGAARTEVSTDITIHQSEGKKKAAEQRNKRRGRVENRRKYFIRACAADASAVFS